MYFISTGVFIGSAGLVVIYAPLFYCIFSKMFSNNYYIRCLISFLSMAALAIVFSCDKKAALWGSIIGTIVYSVLMIIVKINGNESALEYHGEN